MTRRFECVEDASSKFWEVSVTGSEMTVRFGRIGTSGQSKTKSFASELLAQKEADKLVGEKTRKGYAEVGAGAEPIAAKAPVPPQKEQTTPVSKVAAAPPAPDRSDRPWILIDGEPVYFAPPEWIGEHAQPSLSDPASKKRGAPFDKVWALVAQKSAGWGRDDQWYRWNDDAPVSPAARELQRRVRARLESGERGEGFDMELEAATYAIATLVGEADIGSRAIWHWVERSDAKTATRTMLRAMSFGFDFGDENAPLTWPRPLALKMPEETETKSTLQMRDVGALREVMRAFGADELRPIVREGLVASDPISRAHAAWLLEDREAAAKLFEETPSYSYFGIATILPLLAPEAAAQVLPILYDGAPVARLARERGLEIAPHLLRVVAEHENPTPRTWGAALACFPSLRTARLLVPMLETKSDRKLIAEALASMPEHAVIALREGSKKKSKYRDFAEALLGKLAAGEAAPASGSEEAPLDALPAVLAAPPWRAKKKASKASAIEGLTPRAQPHAVDLTEIDRAELEREVQKLWARASADQILERIESGHSAVDAREVMALPFEQIERLRTAGVFAKMRAKYWEHDAYQPGLTVLLHVHGTKIVPALLELAPSLSGKLASELAHAGAVEIAPLAIGWLGSKHTRKAAETWTRRFPSHAAAGLIPIALGAPGTARDRACWLLTQASARGSREVIVAQARALGDHVEEAIRAILDRDPLENAPSKPPKVLDGLDDLPRPLLKDGRALSLDAMRALLEMLAFSPIDPPYAGVEHVRAACDPRSLDRFVEAAVSAWIAAGAPSAHEWIVRAVALVGTDAAARFLFDRARGWAAEGSKTRASLALEVLGAMGTDLALSLVGRVSRSGAKQYMKDRAEEILGEIASARGLSPDELEDRTAPDLGLDESGAMVLDFGPRSFRVGFDERLAPYVRTSEGERLEVLPRANKSDDKDKAKTAWDAWKTLREEAEKVSKDQIARLERMMADERRVDAEIFFELFVRHPLIAHLASRLVWGAWDGEILLSTFRVAEDRTLATIDDDVYELPPGARVGVVHPYALRETPDLVARWGEVLASYEIVQPFGQLVRPATPVSAADIVQRFSGKKAPSALLYSLRAYGWRADADEYGIVGYRKQVNGATYHLGITPGLRSGEKELHALGLTSSADANARQPTTVQLIELTHQLDAIVV
jgi:predicted DNA-binding WGR domain protein